MILSQKKIIKKIDLGNIYAVGNSLIVPIVIDSKKALLNKAKYVKLCVLPKFIAEKTNQNKVFPSQVAKEFDNPIDNKKSIHYVNFGSENINSLNKRILSKNSITTGQSLYQEQDLFISSEEELSNGNLTIYAITDINNVKRTIETFSRRLQLEFNQGTESVEEQTDQEVFNFNVNAFDLPEPINFPQEQFGNSFVTNLNEKGHIFTLSILNENKSVLDFLIVEQSSEIKIRDYRLNSANIDSENTILQYLNAFSDSIQITMNPYRFEGLTNNIVEGPTISYNTSIIGNLTNFINTLLTINTSIAELKIDILDTEIDIQLFKRSEASPFQNNLDLINITNSFGYKLIQNRNLVYNIRRYFYENPDEQELVFTASLTTSLSNTLISRNYVITRREALQLFSDYEFKNRELILKENVGNKISFVSLDNDSYRKKVVKLTFDSPEQFFIDTTNLLRNLKIYIELLLPGKQPIPIPVNTLYLDDELTDDNLVIPIVQDKALFLYDTLFNDPNTNIFYYASTRYNLDFTQAYLKVYADDIDGILIKGDSLIELNRFVFDIPTQNLFQQEREFISSNIAQNIRNNTYSNVFNNNVLLINNLNRQISFNNNSSETNIIFKLGNSDNILKIASVLNYSLEDTLEVSSDKIVVSNILENTLLEIIVHYQSNENNIEEFIFYKKAIEIYNEETQNFELNINNIITNNISSRKISVKSVVFDKNKLEKIFSENASQNDKESVFQTLNNLNRNLFSYYAGKIENKWFKECDESKRQKIYKEIFRVYENKSLFFATNILSLNKTVESGTESETEVLQNDEIKTRKISNIFPLKQNTVKNRSNLNILNTSGDILNECINYKNTDIDISEFQSNLTFSIERNQFILKKTRTNNDYNLVIDTRNYKELQDLKNSKVEIAHHINLGFYENHFNRNESDVDIVKNNTFLISLESLYVNKNLTFDYKSNKIVIKSLDKDRLKQIKTNEEFYNMCIKYWGRNDKNLYLNFILEKYVLKFYTSNGYRLFSLNSLIPANDKSISHMEKNSSTKLLGNKNITSNLGINLLGENLFKPNFSILYN